MYEFYGIFIGVFYCMHLKSEENSSMCQERSIPPLSKHKGIYPHDVILKTLKHSFRSTILETILEKNKRMVS
jgi:hypothetical protein